MQKDFAAFYNHLLSAKPDTFFDIMCYTDLPAFSSYRYLSLKKFNYKKRQATSLRNKKYSSDVWAIVLIHV